MRPWNDWYHVMGNTYGTWLPGSPKGFRTVMRKLHVPFDYKRPPPKGRYDKLHEQREASLDAPARLPRVARAAAPRGGRAGALAPPARHPSRDRFRRPHPL